MELSELYSTVIEWAQSTGAEKINELPGVWHRKTQKVGELGPLDVRINAHKETIDGIPPFGMSIGMDDYFPGLIALLQPNGGALIGSPVDGEDEAGLIAHFKAQIVQ